MTTKMVNDQRGIDEPQGKITGGKTPCGKKGCLEEVLKDSIGCDACHAWYHTECSGLSRTSFGAYSRFKGLTWVCENCFKLLQAVLREKETGSDKAEIASITGLELNGAEGTRTQDTHLLSQTDECVPGVTPRVSMCMFVPQTPSIPDGDLDAGGQAVLARKKRKGKRRRLEEGSICTIVGESQTITQTSQINCKDIVVLNLPEADSKGKPNNAKVEHKNRRAMGAKRPKSPPPVQHSSGDNETNNNLISVLAKISQRLDAQAACLNKLQSEKDDLTKSISRLLATSDFAMGRNRNVIIYGITEPIMRQGKLRDRYMRSEIATLFRKLGIPEHVLVKRVLRLGPWKSALDGAESPPRPMVVEFGNIRHRDKFLAGAEKIRALSKGKISVTPDNVGRTTPDWLIADQKRNADRCWFPLPNYGT